MKVLGIEYVLGRWIRLGWLGVWGGIGHSRNGVD